MTKMAKSHTNTPGHLLPFKLALSLMYVSQVLAEMETKGDFKGKIINEGIDSFYPPSPSFTNY